MSPAVLHVNWKQIVCMVIQRDIYTVYSILTLQSVQCASFMDRHTHTHTHIYTYTVLLYRNPQHHNCHAMSWLKQAIYALCSGQYTDTLLTSTHQLHIQQPLKIELYLCWTSQFNNTSSKLRYWSAYWSAHRCAHQSAHCFGKLM
jgi:hypothetical protein